MSCNCEGIIIEVPREGIDGNGIANIELLSESGLEKTYRINFTNGEYFDYVVTDGSSIASIAKTGTQILVDTYTVTLTDGNTTTFQVTNGRSVVSIAKTNTDVLTDTYTISYNDNTTSTFQVVNGNGIVSIEKTNTDVLVDTYTITLSNNTTVTYQVVNGRGITSITKVGSADLVDTYRILFNDNTYTDYTVTNGEKGDTGTGIVSITKTGSSGLVDTYTVLLSDNTSYTFTVTNGEKGDSATIAIGTVTTGAEGSSATVTNRGDEHDAIWDITIPRGNTGNGISSITLLSQSGLVKTYRITYTNGTHFDFSVSDGNGIASIEKTATVGAVDTYTVTFTDPQAEPFSYDVTNGSDEWGAIVGDIADQTDLQAALDTKAPVIVESASGDLVTITDGADLPVESLSVNVEPVQDLHGYENPWPAGGGKNLLPTISQTQTINGVTWTLNPDGSVKISGTATGNSNCDFGRNVLTLPAGSYTTLDISVTGVIAVVVFGIVSGTATVIKNGGGAFTLEEATSVFVRYSVPSGITANNTTIYPQIELGYTPTAYAPYANICPISGWSQANVTRTGVNLFDKEHLEIFANPMSDGDRYGHTFKKAGTYAVQSYGYDSSQTLYIYAKIRGADGAIKPTTYYIRALAVSTPAIITITEGEILYVYDATSTYSEQQALNHLAVADVQVAYQFTQPDTYQPYQGQQVTIDLDGTRYGGELDVTRGEMLVTMAMTDLGTRTWTYQTSYGYMHSSLLDAKAIGATKVSMICSNFKVVPFSERSSYTTPIVTFDGTNKILQVRNTGYTDVTAFKTAMNGVQLVYPLAQPFEVTLTPTQISSLIGTNNIWADCGAVDVNYRADTKLFVEQSVAEANAVTRKMIADTANGNLAPKSLASGDLIIVGDELRKCTANIGSGSAITGSNSTVATLADVIKALQ